MSVWQHNAFVRSADARLPAEAAWEIAAEDLNADQGTFLDDPGALRPFRAEGHLTPAPHRARDVRLEEADPAFRRDVQNGLTGRPRAIPARWFCDRAGSELFEAITALPEYYVTRTERALLSSAVQEIAELTGPERVIVEFGLGSSTKTRILLSAIRPAAYVRHANNSIRNVFGIIDYPNSPEGLAWTLSSRRMSASHAT
jgi:hypothetical protein